MLNECQTWSEKERMQINAQKSKVMVFHETPAQRRKHKEQVKRQRSDSVPTYPPSFHTQAVSPPHRQCSDLLEEVQEQKPRSGLGSIPLLVVRRQLPAPHTIAQRKSCPNSKPVEDMRIAHLRQNLRYLKENQGERLQVALK
jgi:hypothetical protein